MFYLSKITNNTKGKNKKMALFTHNGKFRGKDENHGLTEVLAPFISSIDKKNILILPGIHDGNMSSYALPKV